MQYFSEEIINIVLPMLILIWTLVIKIIVNHNNSVDGIIEEVLRLPGDISILATTFATTGILILLKKNDSIGVINFVALIVLSFIVTLIIFALCKKEIELNDKGKSKNWKEWLYEIGIFIGTYVISGLMLYVSISFILSEVN
ncbi:MULTISPECIES: hypothetical protein [Bacillus cereus group]|uniref:hypothetical protein n=1 Tax=Bacillus cereus group TaxID=86661 RepID=UPI000BF6BC5E|nr:MULTISPECIES: hypothetical protein [Bacillus cereus group]NIL34989.1 hypothetical protein [Bacillus thuringiensis]PET96228.1 hypothetical protein CN534_23840 [Bacillus cereus]PEZ54703.1 hypothetical protein CN370_27490 [Bacillus cereus]PFB62376.1 hypothetical protein CN292_26975 [Bacillus cereus]HDR8152416.1 hypothetical protein [Bacillus cereus]